MFEVTFQGIRLDDYKRPLHTFEAKVQGYEHSLIEFALRPDGTLGMGSKYFSELSHETQKELIQMARKLM